MNNLEKFVNNYCFKSDDKLISKTHLFNLYKKVESQPVKFVDLKKYCDGIFEQYSGACYARKDYQKRNSHNVYRCYFKNDKCEMFDSKKRDHEEYMNKKNDTRVVEGFIYGFTGKSGIKLCDKNGENLGKFYFDTHKVNSNLMRSQHRGLKVIIAYKRVQGKKKVLNSITNCKLILPKDDEKNTHYVTAGMASYVDENIIQFNDYVSAENRKSNEILNEMIEL